MSAGAGMMQAAALRWPEQRPRSTHHGPRRQVALIATEGVGVARAGGSEHTTRADCNDRTTKTPTGGSDQALSRTRARRGPLHDGGPGCDRAPPVMDRPTGSPGFELSGQIGRLREAPISSRGTPAGNERRGDSLSSRGAQGGGYSSNLYMSKYSGQSLQV